MLLVKACTNKRTTKTTYNLLNLTVFIVPLQTVCSNTINIATVNTSNCWSETPIAKWTMDDKCQLVRFVDNCIQPARILYITTTIDIPWLVHKYVIFISHAKNWRAEGQWQCPWLKNALKQLQLCYEIPSCKHRAIQDYLGDININFSNHRQNWRASL